MPGGTLEMWFENCNNKLQGNSNLGIPAGSTAKPWKTRELNMETLPSGNGIEQRSRELPVLFWNYHYFVLFSWNKLCLSKEAPSDTLGRLESEREHWICVWFYGIQHRLAGKSDFPRRECLLLAAIGVSQPLV